MEHPIENIMRSSMEHIKALADVNTVIGSPISAGGDTLILPVSKVALGMLVGGGEYMAVQQGKRDTRESEQESKYPFIGASTLGMGLTPLAFLTVQNGEVRVLPAKQDCPSDRIIDLIPRMLDTAERLIRELAGQCESTGCGRRRHWSASENECSKEGSDDTHKHDDVSRPFTGEQLKEDDIQ